MEWMGSPQRGARRQEKADGEGGWAPGGKGETARRGKNGVGAGNGPEGAQGAEGKGRGGVGKRTALASTNGFAALVEVDLDEDKELEAGSSGGGLDDAVV